MRRKLYAALLLEPPAEVLPDRFIKCVVPARVCNGMGGMVSADDRREARGSGPTVALAIALALVVGGGGVCTFAHLHVKDTKDAAHGPTRAAF